MATDNNNGRLPPGSPPDKPEAGDPLNDLSIQALTQIRSRLMEMLQQYLHDPLVSELLLSMILKVDQIMESKQAPSGGTIAAVASDEHVHEVLHKLLGDHIGIGENATNSVVGSGSMEAGENIVGRDLIKADRVTQITHFNFLKPKNSKAPRRPKQEKSQVARSKSERAYLTWLMTIANRVPLSQLEIRTADMEHPVTDINLDALYIHLDVQRTQGALTGRSEMTLVPVMDPLNRTRRMVILGNPGAGKSTFLNFLTLCLAGARLYPDRNYLERLDVGQEDNRPHRFWRFGALLPVRLSLADFAASLPESIQKGSRELLMAYIEQELGHSGVTEFGGDLKRLLRRGECMVMLDGLDEVSNPDLRVIVRDSIEAFADLYDDCRYVVSCRSLSYNSSESQLKSFSAVTLAPLSREGVNQFIDNWYLTLSRMGQAYSKTWGIRKAAELRQATLSLQDLAENPMLLTVMALVHTFTGELPRERARLYERCIRLLLWEWQQAKRLATGVLEPGIVEQLGTREERLFTGLCQVAYEAHEAQGSQPGTAYIREAEVMSTFKAVLGSYEKAEQFCTYIEHRAGLLVSNGLDGKGNKVFSFPHRGFQEFLAACHLVNATPFHRSVTRLIAQGDVWHEVVMLAVGHMVYNYNDVKRPLDAVRSLTPETLPTTDQGWRSFWWAGEILNTVGVEVALEDEQVGRSGVRRVLSGLISLVSQGELSAYERAQAADVLGCLGDPRPGVASAYPDMIKIPGGTFTPGGEGKPVRLRPFYLSSFPITNSLYRRFSREGYRSREYWTDEGWEWRKSGGGGSTSAYNTDHSPGNHPVSGVTWYEAVAFTNWLRARTGHPFRLPTEAEWEWAAVGEEGRRYPFGMYAHDGISNNRETGIGRVTAVGIFPDDRTPEGLYDMGGNVREWCSSLAKPYPYDPMDGRENLRLPGPRILRGGFYDLPKRQQHAVNRVEQEPGIRLPVAGFRVALDAPRVTARLLPTGKEAEHA